MSKSREEIKKSLGLKRKAVEMCFEKDLDFETSMDMLTSINDIEEMITDKLMEKEK